MWRLYRDLVKQVPSILWKGLNRLTTGIGLVIFVVWLANPALGKLLNQSWLDFPQWWAFVILGLLFIYGLARANYTAFAVLQEENQAFKTAAAAGSAAPALRLASQFEVDTKEHCFRLRVWNDSEASCQPRVRVMGLVDDQGAAILEPAQAPLELGWTHEEAGKRPNLRKADVEGATVAVLWLSSGITFGRAKEYGVILYGTRQRINLGRLAGFVGRTFRIRIAVDCPERQSPGRVDREFVLVHESMVNDNLAECRT